MPEIKLKSKQIFVKFAFGQVHSWSDQITDPQTDCDYQAIISAVDLDRMLAFAKNSK